MIEETLQQISAWQTKHESDDIRNFEEIKETMKKVADKKDIQDAVNIAVDKTINGKLDDIKKHLVILEQKIDPLDKTRNWLSGLVKALAYLAAIVGSITVILGGLYYLLKLI